jgi:hypothetical protein
MRIYDGFKKQEWMETFYLAGGTALALHMGHRLSDDFDFFTLENFDNDHLANTLSGLGKFERLTEAENTLHGRIDDVNVSFLGYRYPLLKELIRDGHIKIAGMADIACMKLSAMAARGSRKDFIDLFFILKQYSLNELFSWYREKYQIPDYDYVLLKSLIYFQDADEDPMPVMIKKITWDHIKEELMKEVRKYKI